MDKKTIKKNAKNIEELNKVVDENQNLEEKESIEDEKLKLNENNSDSAENLKDSSEEENGKTSEKKDKKANSEDNKTNLFELDSLLSEEGILDFLKEIRKNAKNSNEKTKKKRSSKRTLFVNAEHNSSSKPLLDSQSEFGEGSVRLPQIPNHLPVIPLKDFVVFNSMVIPLYETREYALEAIDNSLSSHRYLFLSAQKNPDIYNPEGEDLHEIGSVVMVLRMVKTAEGQVKLLVQGLSRARALEFSHGKNDYLTAKIDLLDEEKAVGNDINSEALIRVVREQSEKILQLRGIPTQDIMPALMEVDEPGKLADIIATNMRLSINEAQPLLECLNPLERLKKVSNLLQKEVEVANMQAKIQGLAREGMDKAQKDYYLREQMKAIRTELGDGADSEEDLQNLKDALAKAGLPQEVKKEVDKQYKRLLSMHSDSAEAGVIRSYLDWFVELPWKKLSKDNLDIIRAKKILDEDHYGLEKIKDRILEFLAVRKLKPDTKASILCFAGPPGVGKTSLGKSIARSMGRKFQRISLGGMRDEAEIRGHRRTYIGAMPGRIIQAMKQAGTRNPVILLDEIDKLANDFRGDPASALLEALDPEQNAHFSDHYLNVPYDLSRVLFICTANQLDSIPSALRDRLEIIMLSGYTEQEKLEISKKHLVPRQIDVNGFDKKDIVFRAPALSNIIHDYTREAGLRNLEREIGAVCRKLARKRAEGDTSKFTITPEIVRELLGAPRYLDDVKDKSLPPGIAQGLAWTRVGGEVLYVEAMTMKGKGSLTLTGKLGEVMKESATAAMSYARSHAEKLGIDPDFKEKLDIHIHVPDGATPKDGPSAGVTMMTALVSALTERPARADTCMTGEISLRGRVLPVGGIKEKILAGVARKLKYAIIPIQNKKDLEDIPEDLLTKIEVLPMENIDQVLDFVLEKKRKSKKV